MTEDCKNAMLILYKMEKKCTKSLAKDIIEEALNILTRNPHRVGKPGHLAQNARRDACRKLYNRSKLHVDVDPESYALCVQGTPYTTLIEWKDVLAKAEMSVPDQAVMHCCLLGYSARETAAQCRLTQSLVYSARKRVRVIVRMAAKTA